MMLVEGANVFYFDQTPGSNGTPSNQYTARFFNQESLTFSNDQYTLTDSLGDQTVFNGFDLTPANPGPYYKRGSLLSYTAASGGTVTVNAYDPLGNITQVEQGDANGNHNQFLLTYSAVDGVPNAERLQSVKLNNAAGQTFEEVDYTYYKKDDNFGAPGDLKTAADFGNETPGIASGLVQTDGSYYRYVEAPGSTTFGPVNVDPGQTPPAAPLPGLISYVVTGDQFALLAAAEGLMPPSAGGAYDVSALDGLAKDDIVLTQYATLAFAYTGSEATKQMIQGAGQSSYGQGQASQQSAVGTYTYAYDGNSMGDATGMNVWNTATTVSLPGGNDETVYTNAFGEVMLNVLTDTTDSSTTGNAALAGSNWYTFTRLDPAGRILFTANPSAFLAVQPDPTQVDLVAAQPGGSFGDISGSSGLIDYTDYYGSTETAPGFVKGMIYRFTPVAFAGSGPSAHRAM
jgi:hypothetical protein